jgi:hypothetical protein
MVLRMKFQEKKFGFRSGGDEKGTFVVQVFMENEELSLRRPFIFYEVVASLLLSLKKSKQLLSVSLL